LTDLDTLLTRAADLADDDAVRAWLLALRDHGEEYGGGDREEALVASRPL
jgi:hypothetical protein